MNSGNTRRLGLVLIERLPKTKIFKGRTNLSRVGTVGGLYVDAISMFSKYSTHVCEKCFYKQDPKCLFSCPKIVVWGAWDVVSHMKDDAPFPINSHAGLGKDFTKMRSYSILCSVGKLADPIRRGYLSAMFSPHGSQFESQTKISDEYCRILQVRWNVPECSFGLPKSSFGEHNLLNKIVTRCTPQHAQRANARRFSRECKRASGEAIFLGGRNWLKNALANIRYRLKQDDTRPT